MVKLEVEEYSPVVGISSITLEIRQRIRRKGIDVT